MKTASAGAYARFDRLAQIGFERTVLLLARETS